MIGVISEDENHNKIFKPMAGATLGQGVPLGAWCSFEKDVAPSNNWLMAGTTFDATVYPALALYLGTNQVPYRYDHDRPSEVETFVSYGQTVTPFTAQYDAEVVISFSSSTERTITVNGVRVCSTTSSDTLKQVSVSLKKGDTVTITGATSITAYEVTGFYYTHPLFIKATSIASDSDQQSILAQIQAYNTYSTEETFTGKTWIDGKPIYRVVRHTIINSQVSQGYSLSGDVMTGVFTTNAETVADIFALEKTNNNEWVKLYSTGGGSANGIAWKDNATIYNHFGGNIPKEQFIVLEYTKNTD